MEVGLFFPTRAPELSADCVARLGRRADELGFDSLWVPEHVLSFDPPNPSEPVSRRFQLLPDAQGLIDPLATLAFLAALTGRIRLGTGVLLASQRNPVHVAKFAASIDYLSGGRLDLGVGVGWVREEFEALGVPFRERGRRTDECIAVLRALFERDPSQYQGTVFPLPASRHFPKPLQMPLPLHVGGNSDAALRRAARAGDGWYGFDLAPEHFAERVQKLDEALAAAGRRRDQLRISVCPFRQDVDADLLGRYREAGADQVILPAMEVDPQAPTRQIDDYAAHLLPVAQRL